MARLILDGDLMRFPYSGLFQYCQQLSEHLHQALMAEAGTPMYLYLPPRRKRAFTPTVPYVSEHKWHRLVQPFLADCRLWHAPFQSGRILPERWRYPRLKVVLTIHDLNVLHEGKPEAEQRKSLAHTQALIDRSDALVCISEFTKNDVLTHCRTHDKPIYVIHNGAAALPVPPPAPSTYRPARPFLLGIGYLNAKKNFHVALPLLAEAPELELVLIGRHDDPAYVSALHQQARELGVGARVHLPGPVSEADKAWYLHQCQALVHPSRAEGFGLPVVEAMGLGKPVFLSTCTALPEIGGEAAFYFPDFNAETVRHVYRQGTETARSPAHADALRAQAARFDWAESARQYLAVYQAVAPELGLTGLSVRQ
jgi:glycosyltransferase involved in cell wall biosynthesis